MTLVKWWWCLYLSGCGRITTVNTCTCCSSTCAEVSSSRTCAMPASSPIARACSTRPRSRRRSTTSTRCPSSIAISSPRISCLTRTVISNSPTSDLPRGWKTGCVLRYVMSPSLSFVSFLIVFDIPSGHRPLLMRRNNYVKCDMFRFTKFVTIYRPSIAYCFSGVCSCVSVCSSKRTKNSTAQK